MIIIGSTIAPPDEIIQQRAQALANANRIRIGRGTMLKHIRSLPIHESLEELADAVEDPPDMLLSLPVVDLLLAGRRLGAESARGILRRAGDGGPAVPGYVPLERLTVRQREALADILRRRAERSRGDGR